MCGGARRWISDARNVRRLGEKSDRRQTKRQTDRRTSGQTDGRTYERTDGWTKDEAGSREDLHCDSLAVCQDVTDGWICLLPPAASPARPRIFSKATRIQHCFFQMVREKSINKCCRFSFHFNFVLIFERVPKILQSIDKLFQNWFVKSKYFLPFLSLDYIFS